MKAVRPTTDQLTSMVMLLKLWWHDLEAICGLDIKVTIYSYFDLLKLQVYSKSRCADMPSFNYNLKQYCGGVGLVVNIKQVFLLKFILATSHH